MSPLLVFGDQHKTHLGIIADPWGLSSRQLDVLGWVAKGKTNKEIGEILQISPRTVGKHLEHIYAKLGVDTRTAAVDELMNYACKLVLSWKP